MTKADLIPVAGKAKVDSKSLERLEILGQEICASAFHESPAAHVWRHLSFDPKSPDHKQLLVSGFTSVTGVRESLYP